jgi:predicted enzyme related to lactoylglutathione lyase
MPIDSLEIVQIEVKDWARMVKWYVDTLSLQIAIKEDEDKIAFLSFPKGEGKIALHGADNVVTGTKSRAYPCILVSDIDATVKQLQAKRVEFEEGITGGPEKGFRSARIWDPERNSLFLFEWCRPGA